MSGRVDAVVIGGGANGLAAAATLARRRKHVVLLERSDALGGMSRALEFAPGYRAPLGPDCGWAPPRVLGEMGLRRLAVTLPDTGACVRMDDGFLSLPVDTRLAADRIRIHSSHDADRWPALVDRMHALATFLGRLYESAPPDIATTSVAGLASLLGIGRRFRALGERDMVELLRVLPMAIDDFLRDELDHPSMRAAIAAGAVRDIRQGVRSGGTTFVALHYLIGAPAGSVRARGWWAEGPDALVNATAAAARAKGVNLRTNSEVARITVRDDAVSSVILTTGEEIEAPLVVSTADPRRTLLGLVEPAWLDPEFMHAVSNIKYRGCTAVVQFALDALPLPEGLAPRDLAAGLSLSRTMDDIERAYDDVKYGQSSAAPHIELFSPTIRWPDLAPDGKHSVVARVQYVAESEDAPDMLGDRVMRAIDDALPGFSSRVVARNIILPRDLERDFALTGGAMTHGEMTLDQILFMRPVPGHGRYAMPIDGLYLGGAGCSPGPGLPGAAGVPAAMAALASRR